MQGSSSDVGVAETKNFIKALSVPLNKAATFEQHTLDVQIFSSEKTLGIGTHMQHGEHAEQRKDPLAASRRATQADR